MIKIANADEDAAIIAARIAALTHIEQVDPAVPVPRVRPGLNGAKIVSVAGHMVFVLSFLPGELATASPHTPASLRRFGGTLARLGRALRGVFDPATGRRKLLWDMRQVGGLATAVCMNKT